MINVLLGLHFKVQLFALHLGMAPGSQGPLGTGSTGLFPNPCVSHPLFFFYLLITYLFIYYVFAVIMTIPNVLRM